MRILFAIALPLFLLHCGPAPASAGGPSPATPPTGATAYACAGPGSFSGAVTGGYTICGASVGLDENTNATISIVTQAATPAGATLAMTFRFVGAPVVKTYAFGDLGSGSANLLIGSVTDYEADSGAGVGVGSVKLTNVAPYTAAGQTYYNLHGTFTGSLVDNSGGVMPVPTVAVTASF